MATNFFWIGYHFEEFRSQVAIRKKVNFTPWGGLNVLAEEIIDISDGYKGKGFGKSTEEELVCRFWFLHNRTSSQAVPPFSEKSVGQKEKKNSEKGWRKLLAVHLPFFNDFFFWVMQLS